MKFSAPELKLVEFELEDILTASTEEETDDDECLDWSCSTEF